MEKRSRFIGQVWPVESEEEARAHIAAVKKTYHDARHSCWCYRLRDGIQRYSDDGEPQGTAGQPMLGVFQKESVTDVCCVVTRYFGGILLGAGGLVRAYTAAAKLALDVAGRSRVRRWVTLTLAVPYPLYERAKLLAQEAGALPGETQFAGTVTLALSILPDKLDDFTYAITQLTSGATTPIITGEVLRGGPMEDE